MSSLVVPASAVPSNTHKHDRAGQSPKHGQTAAGISRESEPCRALGRGPAFMGQQPGQAQMPGNRFQKWKSQAPSCPWVGGLQAAAEGLMKPCSGPSPGAHSVQLGVTHSCGSLGAWEHLPGETQTGDKVRKLPTKDLSREASGGDTWPKTLVLSTDVS